MEKVTHNTKIVKDITDLSITAARTDMILLTRKTISSIETITTLWYLSHHLYITTPLLWYWLLTVTFRVQVLPQLKKKPHKNILCIKHINCNCVGSEVGQLTVAVNPVGHLGRAKQLPQLVWWIGNMIMQQLTAVTNSYGSDIEGGTEPIDNWVQLRWFNNSINDMNNPIPHSNVVHYQISTTQWYRALNMQDSLICE